MFQRMYAIQVRSVRLRFSVARGTDFLSVPDGMQFRPAFSLSQFHFNRIGHFNPFADRTDDLLC